MAEPVEHHKSMMVHEVISLVLHRTERPVRGAEYTGPDKAVCPMPTSADLNQPALSSFAPAMAHTDRGLRSDAVRR